MNEGGTGSTRPTLSPYEEAMGALSSLITKRSRADKSNKGDRFDLLFDYLKVIGYVWWSLKICLLCKIQDYGGFYSIHDIFCVIFGF